jgi:hypothetical protein
MTFLSDFCDAVAFEKRDVLFAIGRALKGHVHEEKMEIFSISTNFAARIGPANKAMAFYDAQVVAAKCAVKTWSLVGIRCKVVKDIRILIGKLIWESREEGLYRVAWLN